MFLNGIIPAGRVSDHRSAGYFYALKLSLFFGAEIMNSINLNGTLVIVGAFYLATPNSVSFFRTSVVYIYIAPEPQQFYCKISITHHSGGIGYEEYDRDKDLRF